MSDFIGFCRYVVLLPEDADKVYQRLRYGIPFKGYIEKVSIENETATWKQITKIVDKALSEYPTTLDEDKELLEKDAKENSLSLNQKNCIRYRMSEKKVLHFLKDCSRQILEFANMTGEEATAEIERRENEEEFKKIRGYLFGSICPLLQGSE